MKVISIGSDRKLFEEGSEVRRRAASYAARLGELHVIVFSLKKHRLQEMRVGPLHIYPTNSSSKLWYIPDTAKVGKKLLTDTDVVTVQDPFESGLTGLVVHKGRPLHIQVHTDLFSKGFKKDFRNRIRLMIARFVLPRAARIRTVSETIADRLHTTYPNIPISVLPIYVDIQKYQAVEKHSHPRFKTTLLWVGRFEWEKNPALAIRAFAETHKTNKDAGLVMLGGGSEEQELRRLANKLGVADRVEFPSWQEPLSYMKVADLLLVTSRYEGYGRQIVEALAAGVPVLATDVGIAREAGAIIASEKEFAAALTQWMANGPRKAELKDYPYRNFEEYVEKYCADLEAAIGK